MTEKNTRRDSAAPRGCFLFYFFLCCFLLMPLMTSFFKRSNSHIRGCYAGFISVRMRRAFKAYKAIAVIVHALRHRGMGIKRRENRYIRQMLPEFF